MNKLLKTLFLYTSLTLPAMLAPSGHLHAQNPSLRDSIQQLLNYFYAATGDGRLKQDIEAAKQYYITDIPSDSAALRLISIVKQTREIYIDYMLVDIHTFNKEKVWEFANIISELFQYIPPQGWSKWYAASLHQLGLTFSCTIENYPVEARKYFLKALQIRKKLPAEQDAAYFETLFYAAWLDDDTADPFRKLKRMMMAFESRNALPSLTASF